MGRQTVQPKRYGNTAVGGSAKVQLGDSQITKNYHIGAVNLTVPEELLQFLQDAKANVDVKSHRTRLDKRSAERIALRKRNNIIGSSKKGALARRGHGCARTICGKVVLDEVEDVQPDPEHVLGYAENNELDRHENPEEASSPSLNQVSGSSPALRLREPTWLERVRDLFDFRQPEGWRNNAPFHRQLLEWMDEFEMDGVDRALLELWQHDIGHLVRPFVWIIPSLDKKKTLFRLAKPTYGKPTSGKPLPNLFQPPNDLPRSRTVWHLPGKIVPGDEKLTSLQTLSPFPRTAEQVQTLHRQLYRDIDPFRHAQQYLDRHTEITKMPSNALQQKAWRKLPDDAVDEMRTFQSPNVGWVKPGNQDSKRYGGQLVQLWTHDDGFSTQLWRGLRVRFDVYGARAAATQGDLTREHPPS